MSFFSNPKSYLLILISLSFLLPFNASAGVIRKPPNNLGLLLYYPMNEGGGTVAGDFSGNGRNGTLAGTALPTWINGKFGKALQFVGDESGNRIELSSALALGSTHTVSLWLYL